MFVVELYNADIYQKSNCILQSVTLKIAKGEFVYLIGKTGTGKSSLLKTLYGDLPLRQGIGKVVGEDLKKITWKNIPQLRRKLGIIFQDFHLLMDRNVEDNLRFALEVTGWTSKKEIQKKIDDVLTNVSMSRYKKSMPFELSGGEQQRVVIARSLLNNPELILADEPTGNLDPETSYDIMHLLHLISTQTDTAIIIGTHDIYTMNRFPGKFIKCEKGKVALTDKML